MPYVTDPFYLTKKAEPENRLEIERQADEVRLAKVLLVIFHLADVQRVAESAKFGLMVRGRQESVSSE
jgi:hypothetical protein